MRRADHDVSTADLILTHLKSLKELTKFRKLPSFSKQQLKIITDTANLDPTKTALNQFKFPKTKVIQKNLIGQLSEFNPTAGPTIEKIKNCLAENL